MKPDVFVIKENNLSTNNDTLLLQETLFHSANGYLGARGCYEEGYPEEYQSVRGQYINGFHDIVPMKQAESLYGLADTKETILNVVDTQGIRLYVDGQAFDCFGDGLLDGSRTLDMRVGTVRREATFSTKKGNIRVSITRMASLDLLPLFTIEYKVQSVDFLGQLIFESTHKGDVSNFSDPNDPRVSEIGCHILSDDARVTPECYTLINARAKNSSLTLTSVVCNRLSNGREGGIDLNGSTATRRFSADISPGEEIILEKYTVICDSLRYPNPEEAAGALMKEALGTPLAIWYQKQKDYLARFWDNCAVRIEGDESLQRALIYNQYQLLQSSGKDGRSNVAAKGLSGEGYEGHYFWDTEMYIIPFFALTNPAVARKLLEYRHSILPAARENARVMGHDAGALFAWRTISGRECSGFFPAGSAQYHINGDIAYAVISYWLLTGDLDFMRHFGAEILFETARLWLDVGYYDGSRFVIHCVTGPDEYTCVVNNNYYTNALAKYNLHWAAKVYDLLEEKDAEEAKRFQKASDAMYLPFDEALGINPQDDSFLHKKPWALSDIPEGKHPLLLHYHPLALYRRQICKQADTVLSHFLLEDYQPPDVIRRSFKYYEKCTTHDSSLSTCIFSIMAARIGDANKALYYFGESAKMDLNNTHLNTKDGIHTANMGGSYMAVVYGFGGLRVKETGLFLSPSLPDTWKEYSFPFAYQGSNFSLTVKPEGYAIKLQSGPEKTLFVYGRPHRVQDIVQGELLS